MAGSKGSKYFNVFLNYSISLEHKELGKIINSDNFQLLKSIQATESLKDAAIELDISYRKAWGLLQDMEVALGFKLVDRQRGGALGGKSYNFV